MIVQITQFFLSRINHTLCHFVTPPSREEVWFPFLKLELRFSDGNPVLTDGCCCLNLPDFLDGHSPELPVSVAASY